VANPQPVASPQAVVRRQPVASPQAVVRRQPAASPQLVASRQPVASPQPVASLQLVTSLPAVANPQSLDPRTATAVVRRPGEPAPAAADKAAGSLAAEGTKLAVRSPQPVGRMPAIPARAVQAPAATLAARVRTPDATPPTRGTIPPAMPQATRARRPRPTTHAHRPARTAP
jgi:hypothetical protein